LKVKAFLESSGSHHLVLQRDIGFSTVLHKACHVQNIELVGLLIQIDKDLVPMKDSRGWTCIHHYIHGLEEPEVRVIGSFLHVSIVCHRSRQIPMLGLRESARKPI